MNANYDMDLELLEETLVSAKPHGDPEPLFAEAEVLSALDDLFDEVE